MPARSLAIGLAATLAVAVLPGQAFAQYYRYRGDGGAAAAGIVGGLAAGALIGGAIASAPPPPPAYGYGPGPAGYGPGAAGYGPGAPVGNVYGRDPNWVSYCASRYPGFDPISGTFVAANGYRYPCR